MDSHPIQGASRVSSATLSAGDRALLIADAVFAAGRLAEGAAIKDLDDEEMAALAFARELLSDAAAIQRGHEPRPLPLFGIGALDPITVVAEGAPDKNGGVAAHADLYVEMLDRYLQGTPTEQDSCVLSEFRSSFVSLARRTLARAADTLAAQKDPARWTSLNSTSGS